jgi:hypothetical protein
MGIIDLLRRAVELFIDEKKASKSFLQRKLIYDDSMLEYSMASLIMDELQLIGVISIQDGKNYLLVSSMDEFE